MDVLTGVCHFFSETGTEGGHWAFQDAAYITPAGPGRSHPSWSYEGLHILEDGDRLTIFDREDGSMVVWKGEISLVQHPLFTEDAFGFWIHADQRGIERERWGKWFFGEYPAELVKKCAAS
jgi:hypothetical protein